MKQVAMQTLAQVVATPAYSLKQVAMYSLYSCSGSGYPRKLFKQVAMNTLAQVAATPAYS